jgi:predicted O-methyltransferase YrrM
MVGSEFLLGRTAALLQKLNVTRAKWTTVDDYLKDLLAPSDDVLQNALQVSEDAGLPPIQVTATQGKLLYLLARMIGARRILEIGTLGGYSAIWLGRALPSDGQLVTLESEPSYAKIACENLARAGLDTKVEVRLGLALETLALLAAENADPFDLIFIDADKAIPRPISRSPSRSHAPAL